MSSGAVIHAAEEQEEGVLVGGGCAGYGGVKSVLNSSTLLCTPPMKRLWMRLCGNACQWLNEPQPDFRLC